MYVCVYIYKHQQNIIPGVRAAAALHPGRPVDSGRLGDPMKVERL